MNNGIIQIIGISGSGKSTIAKASAQDLGIKFIDFADLIVTSANILGGNSNSHDDIINYSPSFLTDSVNLARTSLAKITTSELLIVETHLAPRIMNLWYTFTTPQVIKERNTLGIVVIADDLKEINLKKHDRLAKRDSENTSYEILKEMQEINIQAAIVCCVVLGIPLQIIWNKYNHLESSVTQLNEFIKNNIKC